MVEKKETLQEVIARTVLDYHRRKKLKLKNAA